MASEDLREPLVFEDLSPIEVPVTIKDRKYILREADGDAARQYRNCMTKGAKITDDGKVIGIPDIADAEITLVSLCLYNILADGTVNAHNVPYQVVKKWPDRVIKKIFERAKAISPSLEISGKQTAEDLRKTIARLQEKLDQLESSGKNGEAELEEERLKNSQGAMTAGSV